MKFFIKPFKNLHNTRVFTKEKTMNSSENQTHPSLGTKSVSKEYLVLWYGLPHYIKVRAPNKSFTSCKYSNCKLSNTIQDFPQADAVIFKGRALPSKLQFQRPQGQVWIFYEHEAPITYNLEGDRWKTPQYKGAFNWTMTYDKINADIYIPYGEFVESQNRTKARDYHAIANNKSKDALIVTSHCATSSKRMEYINNLKQYINVDVYGSCGVPLKCGQMFMPNGDCFPDLFSKYRYYLAFENTFCRGYRTEKLFENFQFDILLIARGDVSSFRNDSREAKGAYITTSDFPTVDELGQYLKTISRSPEEYEKLLEKKSKYESVPYENLYQRALCDICERMSNQDRYRKQVVDLVTWRDIDDVCHSPDDIPNS